MHTRTFAAIVVSVAVGALVGVGAPGPASADARTAAPGISEDEIQIVALVSDLKGHLYVADSGNHVIRKVSASGEVSTLAGSPGKSQK